MNNIITESKLYDTYDIFFYINQHVKCPYKIIDIFTNKNNEGLMVNILTYTGQIKTLSVNFHPSYQSKTVNLKSNTIKTNNKTTSNLQLKNILKDDPIFPNCDPNFPYSKDDPEAASLFKDLTARIDHQLSTSGAYKLGGPIPYIYNDGIHDERAEIIYPTNDENGCDINDNRFLNYTSPITGNKYILYKNDVIILAIISGSTGKIYKYLIPV